MISSLIGGAFSGLQSIAQGISGSINNKHALAQQQNQFNQMMDWNKYVLDSTREREDNAYQRQAQDMKLAGINPLMAGLGGGSASGGGLMGFPSGVDYIGAAANQNAAIDNALGRGLEGLQLAQEQARIKQEQQRIDNDKQRVVNETKKNGAEIANLMKDLDVKDIDILTKQMQLQLGNAELNKIHSETNKLGSEIETLAKQRQLLQQQIDESKDRMKTNQLEREMRKLDKEYKTVMDRFYGAVNDITGDEDSTTQYIDLVAGLALGLPLAGGAKAVGTGLAKGIQGLAKKFVKKPDLPNVSVLGNRGRKAYGRR